MGGQLAGVVACGAGFVPSEMPKKIPFALFAVAGIDDFNHDELHALSLNLVRGGARQRYAEFEGGHEWLPEAQALEALRFFNGKLPVLAAVASKDDRRETDRLRDMLQRIEDSNGKGEVKLIAPITPTRKLCWTAREDRSAEAMVVFLRWMWTW